MRVSRSRDPRGSKRIPACLGITAALALGGIAGCGTEDVPTSVSVPEPLAAPTVETQNSQIAALAEHVRRLVDDGRLGSGQANGLLAQLARAGSAADSGNTTSLDQSLDALLKVIRGLLQAGILDPADAAPLQTGAENLVRAGIALASVTLGERHACGLSDEGVAYCWGANDLGQLGNGSTAASAVPVPVAGGLIFESLEAAGGYTCGLIAGGATHCWGQNIGAQLGNGTTTDSPLPTPVSGSLSFAELALGTDHACGLVATGEAYCWGGALLVEGREHGLGFAPSEPCEGRRSGLDYLCASTPTPVPTTLRFTAIGVGEWHTCALTEGNDAYCWGWNPIFCTLGLGDACSSTLGTPIPQQVVNGSDIVDLASGVGANCGFLLSGTINCWGFGVTAGSLEFAVPVATPLPGGIAFTDVDISGEDFIHSHACGVSVAGTAYCWGASGNLNGETLFGNLGDGLLSAETCAFNAPCTITPSPVFGGIEFADVAAGKAFSCGVAMTGETYCWGQNDEGQLGTGELVWQTTPARVALPQA